MSTESHSIDLSPIMNAVEASARHLDGRISEVQLDVGQLQSVAVTTRDELTELRERFEEYVDQAEKVANIQRAETKLSALKADLDREFGHHNVVRRTSIGMLQAFDVGNVSNRTVTQVSEELMIQTPRYWLAPALVALAGWSRGDEAMVKRSLSEAYRRDPRKTSLFFALVLRRQARLDTSVRWLRQYLLGLDPMLLSREFVVVLECVNLGAFGSQGVVMASTQISEWNTKLRDDPDVVENQVEIWRKFVGTHRQRLDKDEFPALRALSPDWAQLESLLESASAIPVTIEWFERINGRIDERTSVAEDVLDDILETLVTEFDSDELPLRREILLNESIIEEDGAMDRANERADVLRTTLDETLDVVSLQTSAALRPDSLGVGVGTQRATIGTSRHEAMAGIGRYTVDYRSRLVPDIGIVLGPSHSAYAQQFGFPGWSVRSSASEQEAIQSLVYTWEMALSSRRLNLAFSWKLMTKPIVITVIIALFLLLIPPHWLGLLALMIGGLIIVFVGADKKNTAEQAIAKLDAAKDEAVSESVRQYRAGIADYVDAGTLYRELDSYEAELLEILSTWPVGQISVTKG